MTGPILEFDRLVGGYGGGTVVHGVGAAVEPGETLCVLGRNGVGKTTLLALLYGFLAPAGGTVRFAGAEITGLAPVRLVISKRLSTSYLMLLSEDTIPV